MNILSLQSHVVYGHVGNSAAVFPLQRLGHEVWALNTVSFSNHPKHGRFRGHVVKSYDVVDLVAGLDDLGVLSGCDAVLTGYLGDVPVGRAVLEAVEAVRKRSLRAFYCCDPVMGHEQDGFFVPEDLCILFRENVVPAADAVTPNQFELEYLAERSVATLGDAVEASARIRNLGPDLVIVTSLSVREIPKPMIGTFAATKDGAWLVTTPRLSGDLFGAGDLFAALFLGNYLRDRDIARSLSSAVAAAYGVLTETAKAGASELALIEAQDEIVAPSRMFDVEQVV